MCVPGINKMTLDIYDYKLSLYKIYEDGVYTVYLSYAWPVTILGESSQGKRTSIRRA